MVQGTQGGWSKVGAQASVGSKAKSGPCLWPVGPGSSLTLIMWVECTA